jgi:hypothetical protein
MTERKKTSSQTATVDVESAKRKAAGDSECKQKATAAAAIFF